MEMKLQSQNLHQHVMNTLYRDKSGCDTVLRVGQASYLCHAAILASSSSLLHSALMDPPVDNLELLTIVLDGWTKEEAELYMKQTYNQVDMLLPEELVKVESVLSFRVRPQSVRLQSCISNPLPLPRNNRKSPNLILTMKEKKETQIPVWRTTAAIQTLPAPGSVPVLTRNLKLGNPGIRKTWRSSARTPGPGCVNTATNITNTSGPTISTSI